MTDLDPLIHAPKRLRIMTILHTADSVEFAFLQDRLGLSASDLSKQMSALAEAGYAKAKKTGRGPGSTTWYNLTRSGRAAYKSHVAALRALLDDAVELEGGATVEGDG